MACNVTAEKKIIGVDLGSELQNVHAGWTDELQPLDKYVFGAMKAMCGCLVHGHCEHSEDGRVSKSDMIRILVQIWESLEAHVIEKGWGVYEDTDGDGVAEDEWETALDSEEELDDLEMVDFMTRNWNITPSASPSPSAPY
jgi:hypothetical protein